MPAKKKTKQQEVLIHYWPVKGRAEIIRLALVLAGVAWKEEAPKPDTKEMKMKAGTAEFPFGQWPLLVDGETVLCQSSAILRHLGRANGMYGKNKNEDYISDCIIAGAGDLLEKFYHFSRNENKAEGYAKFEKEHIAAESKTERNGGAHMAYLEAFLERSKTEFVTGGKNVTIGDIMLFDVFDKICEKLDAEKVKKHYPKLAEHHKMFSEIEEVAEYLASEKRPKE
jgi:glutathione S-transferase